MDKKNVDIVRLLVERGSDISTKDKNGKNALQIINDIKKPIIEDEEVRTYLEQISIQNMGIKMGEKKELNSDETRKMKGIVYNLENEKLLIGDTKFKIDIDYTGEGVGLPRGCKHTRRAETARHGAEPCTTARVSGAAAVQDRLLEAARRAQ